MMKDSKKLLGCFLNFSCVRLEKKNEAFRYILTQIINSPFCQILCLFIEYF